MAGNKSNELIRITFVLDGNLHKKLRQAQAKKITDTSETISFSEIVNEYLKKGLES